MHFPPKDRVILDPYLPDNNQNDTTSNDHPHTTLTFATSLDGAIALEPGTQTVLSGDESRAMTHYLRARHDAILVGSGTAIADDPGLDCRLEDADGRSPIPIVLDVHGRWEGIASAAMITRAREGRGRAPIVICSKRVLSSDDGEGEVARCRRWRETAEHALRSCGGKLVGLETVKVQDGGKIRERFDWRDVLRYLAREEGLRSVMIEGGAGVIRSLLDEDDKVGGGLVDAVVLTIAPTWLGEGSLVVTPSRPVRSNRPPVRLKDVKWHQLGEDVILCGRLLR